MDEPGYLSAAAVELLEGWPLYDNAIVGHGFTPSARDYEVLVNASAAVPGGGARSYLEGRYRFRFTHCVLAEVRSTLAAESWKASWDDVYADFGAWERAGAPAGYVWGVDYMAAHPGAAYVRGSAMAADWSARLGQPMHEVRIETNAQSLRIVFHRVVVHRVAVGDASTGLLTPIEPVEISEHAT